MGKGKFKKLLRKEKNEILRDRRILYPLIVLDIIITLLNVIIIERGFTSIEKSIYFELSTALIVIGVSLVFQIPAICIDILTDIKIGKMYKKYKKGEDYKNSCKRINKPVIICSFILALIGVIILLNFTYCQFTANKPILSIKVNDEKHVEKYKTLLYVFYKYSDGRKCINLRGTKFEDPYIVNIENEKILLERTEIEKGKVYMGIPNNFIKSSQEHIDNRYQASNIAISNTDYYQNENGKVNLNIRKTDYDLKDDEVEDFLDYLIYLYDNAFGEHITWGETAIQTVGEDKKIGILEYNINNPDIENAEYYCFMWIYSINGKCIINSFDVDKEYEKEWKNLGEKIEKTLEFVNK